MNKYILLPTNIMSFPFLCGLQRYVSSKNAGLMEVRERIFFYSMTLILTLHDEEFGWLLIYNDIFGQGNDNGGRTVVLMKSHSYIVWMIIYCTSSPCILEINSQLTGPVPHKSIAVWNFLWVLKKRKSWELAKGKFLYRPYA